MSDQHNSFDAYAKANYHLVEPGSQHLQDHPRPSDGFGPYEATASLSDGHPGSSQQHGRGDWGYHIWPQASSAPGTYGTRQLDEDEFSYGFQDWNSSFPSYAAFSTHEQPPPLPASPDLFAQSEWDVATQSSAPPTECEGFQWPQDTSQTNFIAISPTFEDGPGAENGADEEEVASSPSPEDTVTEAQQGRNVSQKMHQCQLCGKEFPRPSGLRTHMNSHNDERPFTCEFPGCEKAFSVLSNARRHYRTHGVEPPSSLRASGSSSRGRGYAVSFAAPMTPELPTPSVTSQAPFRVRWIEPNAATRGAGWGLRQTELEPEVDPDAHPVEDSGQ